MTRRLIGWGLVSLSSLFYAGILAAQETAYIGQPQPWAVGFQEPQTEIMHYIVWMHDWLLMPIITATTIFVVGLLAYVAIKFRKSKNPVPSTVTHNSTLEVLWTAIPILILVIIAIPSFRLLYLSHVVPANIDVTIKATGQQWYWDYEYVDQEDLSFSASVKYRELGEGTPEEPRLMATDNPLVLPVGKNILIQVRADAETGVIHAWGVPAFGVKQDAVPGHLNETWFNIQTAGTYYGFCYELCGLDHAYMPIMVYAVESDVYDAWVAKAATDLDGANDDVRAMIHNPQSTAIQIAAAE